MRLAVIPTLSEIGFCCERVGGVLLQITLVALSSTLGFSICWAALIEVENLSLLGPATTPLLYFRVRYMNFKDV